MPRQLLLLGRAQLVMVKCQPLVTGKKVKCQTAGSKLVFECVPEVNGHGVNGALRNDLTVAFSGLETKSWTVFLLVMSAPTILLIRCNLRQMLNLLVAIPL